LILTNFTKRLESRLALLGNTGKIFPSFLGSCSLVRIGKTVLRPEFRQDEVSTDIAGTQTYITYNTTLGCCNSPVGYATFVIPFSISYNGSWNLHYWLEDVPNSIEGNLNGSGNSDISINFYGAGVYNLCVNATKLDSSQNNLTLAVLMSTNSTVAPNATVEACGSMGGP